MGSGALGGGEGRPEQAYLVRRGEAWSIALRPRALTVQHSRGMAYLARLLEQPGVDIHVLDLQGGGGAPAPWATERARINVIRAIRTAIRRIAQHDLALGVHLDNAVRTGTFCAYCGSLERPIEWSVEGEE